MEMKRPLFSKPLGPSELSGKLEKYWNPFVRIGTERSVICEICGTTHPKGSVYTLRSFLGLQVIEQCCGAIFDRVYNELGEEFALVFLADLSENPTSKKSKTFLRVLKKALPDAERVLAKTTEAVAEISAAAEKL